MALKTLYKNLNKEAGVTLFEMLLVVTILTILFSVTYFLIDPASILKRGRDNKRISDLSLLERVLSEYKVDEGTYPDLEGTLRDSRTLPSGSTALPTASSGWIGENLAGYTSRLPLDPINSETYYYRYFHNGNTFELNAKLEYQTDTMQNDGGDDDAWYETGNNLNLISP